MAISKSSRTKKAHSTSKPSKSKSHKEPAKSKSHKEPVKSKSHKKHAKTSDDDESNETLKKKVRKLEKENLELKKEILELKEKNRELAEGQKKGKKAKATGVKTFDSLVNLPPPKKGYTYNICTGRLRKTPKKAILFTTPDDKVTMHGVVTDLVHPLPDEYIEHAKLPTKEGKITRIEGKGLLSTECPTVVVKTTGGTKRIMVIHPLHKRVMGALKKGPHGNSFCVLTPALCNLAKCAGYDVPSKSPTKKEFIDGCGKKASSSKSKTKAKKEESEEEEEEESEETPKKGKGKKTADESSSESSSTDSDSDDSDSDDDYYDYYDYYYDYYDYDDDDYSDESSESSSS